MVLDTSVYENMIKKIPKIRVSPFEKVIKTQNFI